MSLLAFFAACGIGAVACLLARPSARIGRLVGIAGLLTAFVATLFVGPATSLSLGDVTLTGSAYAGLLLACAAGSGLILCLVALASGWSEELAPAALASFAGLALAMTTAEPGISLAAGAAATTAGALVVSVRPDRPEHDGRLAEIRTIGLVAAAMLLAAVAAMRLPWNGGSSSTVAPLAFFGLALALAVRSGAVPFHAPAARLGRSATALAPALLLIWLPAGLGILALSWSASTFVIESDWLAMGSAVIGAVAVATIVLGGLAALFHDELGEVVVYSIVSDAGFVLLALAARAEAAAEPARLWLLAFVVAKTGLVAWSAAVGRAFGTSNVSRLRGWLRRTPLLGLALVAIAAATLGWPGGAVYQARSTLVQLALPGSLQLVFVAAVMLSLACHGRLLAVGLLSPTVEVRSSASELPRLSVGPLQAPLATVDGTDATCGSTVPAVEAAAPGPEALGTGADIAADAKKPRRRGARAAAAAAPPTSQMELAIPIDEPADRTTPAVLSAPEPRPSPGLKMAAIWRLNRTMEVSLVVLSGSTLAMVIAFGGLGASTASQSGIPLDSATAHARPSPTPRITPALAPTPSPKLGPTPTAVTPGPAGASDSAGGLATPASR